MKKILLIAVMLMTGLNASSFEESKKACDGGETAGCLNLGNMYYQGEGVRQSNDIAQVYYGKACDGGNARGCKNYAILNEE